MRVTLITESLYPCGVKIVIDDTIEYISNIDDDITLEIIGSYYPGLQYDNCILLPSKAIGGNRGYRRTLLFSPSSGSVIRKIIQNSDIVHIHSISLLTLRTFAILRSIQNRPKVIFHAHTQADEYLRSWYGPLAPAMVFATNKAIRFCCENSDVILTPSQYFADSFTNSLNLSKKPLVWQAPIEIPSTFDFLDPILLGNTNQEDCGLVLFYVGRVGNEKNIKRMLGVFSQIVTIQQKAKLVLAGGGEVQRFSKYADSLGIGKNVLFLDNIPHQQVLALNKFLVNRSNGKAVSAGITLSTTETQGLGICEQMATGLPVVVPKSTCMAEEVTQCQGGIIVDLNLTDYQIAHNIYSAINDPTQWRHMSDNAYAHIKGNFSPEVQYRKLIEIYHSLND